MGDQSAGGGSAEEYTSDSLRPGGADRDVGTNYGQSPGAMGGRTKTIGDKPQAPLQRLTPEERRKRLRGMIPGTGSLKKLFTAQQKAAKGTLKGAGGAGSALAAQAMKLAKQIKKTGRLSVADLQRAKQMMMEKKGK